MPISFTLEDFLRMMASYNTAFWPLQFAAYLLGTIAVLFAFRGTAQSSRIVSLILALFWIWVGIFFNGLYFRKLSSTAMIFAVLFVLEGILLITTGILGKGLRFKVKPDAYGLLGGLLILYGMAGYPLIEILLGRGYPRLLPFGLVPCPTTTFTLGLFFWSERRLPKYLLIIPFLYSLGDIIPASLGIVEDFVLVAAGMVTVILILYRDRAYRRGPELLPH